MRARFGSSEMPKRIPFLYVDDHVEDHVLLREACRLAANGFDFQSVDSYEQAINYLSGAGKFADRQQFPLPELVMVDYNLEPRSGSEVVAWIRLQPRFNHVPVLVYSGMDTMENVDECYAAGADCFLVKPLTFKSVQGVVMVLAKACESEPPALDLLKTLPCYRGPSVQQDIYPPSAADSTTADQPRNEP